MKWLKAVMYDTTKIVYIQVSQIISMKPEKSLINVYLTGDGYYAIYYGYKIISELVALEEVQNASV